MTALKNIRNAMDNVIKIICIVLFAFMVIIGTYQILVRYIFNSPSTVSEELLTYSFTWMSLFAAAYVFGKRDHMRMGFVADKLSPDKLKKLNIVIELVTIAFSCIVMIYGGICCSCTKFLKEENKTQYSVDYIYSSTEGLKLSVNALYALQRNLFNDCLLYTSPSPRDCS